MRQLGTVDSAEHAQRFADYLLTLGITGIVEQEGDTWEIWVREEEHLRQSVEEFKAFQTEPDAEKYADCGQQAESLRREEHERRQRAQKNIVEMRGNWGTGFGKRVPGVFMLIAVCVLVALLTNVGMNLDNKYVKLLLFAEPEAALEEAVNSGSSELEVDVFRDIRRGEVWRLATPMFLHGGWFHLLMNAYWLYYLGGQIEQRRGIARLLIFAFISGIIANIFQAVISAYALNSPAPTWFGGMSGVVYAAFGYVWMKSAFEHNSGFYLSPLTATFLVVYFFLCFTDYLGPIANTAHAFGLFFGVVVGYLPQLAPGLKKFL